MITVGKDLRTSLAQIASICYVGHMQRVEHNMGDEISNHKERLEAVRKVLSLALEKYTFVDVDFMLRAHIEDFFKCLSALCFSQHSGDEDEGMALRLCELSREIRFAVGSVGHIPGDLRQAVQELFVLASDVVKALRKGTLDAYAENIRQRVDKLVPRTREHVAHTVD